MMEAQPALADAAQTGRVFSGQPSSRAFPEKRWLRKIRHAQCANSARRHWKAQTAKIIESEKLVWDKEKFANRCAGCHSTAVDPETKAFSAFGLDCYVCHGDVDLNHTGDTSKILLSKKRRSDAKMITSVCAQCHLRESKSRSTGLPYPNNFIAGDNLFQDLEVDWRKADDDKLNAGDRHIWRNVRDVALDGTNQSPV